MKPSRFNIVQLFRGTILLYNTYSTSMVELEPQVYTDIFEHGNSGYSTEIQQLMQMGFLVEDYVDELSEQKQLRDAVVSSCDKTISNIIIAPTLACNARCFYCFENGYRKGIMTPDTARAVVQFLKEHWDGAKIGITWFGGEPLLAADIIEIIVDELNKEGIPFGSKITTNGSLLTNEMVYRIQKKWNVDQIQITVDALGAEYNAIKNYVDIDDAFSLVMENIRRCLEAKLPVRIRINFDPDKMDTAVKTMEYMNSVFGGVANLKVYFAPIDEDDCVVRNITDSFKDQDEHPYIRLIKYGREIGLYQGFPDMEDDQYTQEFDTHGLLKKLKIYPQPINCYASCQNVFSIDCYGKLYKCHRGLGRDEYACGDVFAGVEKNEIYSFFCDTEVSMDECNDCAILPICQGGCKINSRLYKGKGRCAPSKAIINQLVQLYREDLEKEGRV